MTAEEILRDAKLCLGDDDKYWVFPDQMATLFNAGAEDLGQNPQHGGGYCRKARFRGIVFLSSDPEPIPGP